ncbi:MAG: hypothetical protein K9L87_03735 [Candidatus Omnitrophica bacterium]|nr:hypothetical protein [Candidatus Omnitrophota bacterium]MCF7877359.1 hypothetical protein [Candidatus Omnitrophota bacterium]MCF7892205.1 hypothetical protein [Candidatus Omnitrophota bacterium]MCF7895462.1 hypothetical protein [Candidatus Omnitrophota bacterium]MCF7897842.1 hypothetical protein [Candidatus Omnitrophota bacterium]
MKRLFIIAGIVVFFLGGILLSKDLIIKSIATKSASKAIGAPVDIDNFSLNIFSSTVDISGLKIYNPSGYPEGILVSCPKIKIIYDFGSFLKRKPHLLLVEVELKEMILTTNKEGKLSVDSLKIAQEPEGPPPAPVKIDLFNLSIGRIITKDYTTDNPPKVRVHNINRQKSYKGIPTARQLIFLVLTEPMKAAAIENAAIYGATLATGFTVLPIVVATKFIGKDHVQNVVDLNFKDLYKISLEVMKNKGQITKEDPSGGAIKATIEGARVALALRQISDDKTEITISARRFMFPQVEIAAGILYQIVDKL